MADATSLLHGKQADKDHPERVRLGVAYDPLYSFNLPKDEQHEFAQQYADLYYVRLDELKGTVETRAEERWRDFTIAGERVKRVKRVLDVKQGELSWAVGTIYVELPNRPNVVEEVVTGLDIAEIEEVSSYVDPAVAPRIMLEDPSGRLRLGGQMLRRELLVTGVITAVLGTETAKGEFEVIEMLLPESPPQPDRWHSHAQRQEAEDAMDVEEPAQALSKKIAFVSGLWMGNPEGDTLEVELLTQYLLGELGVDTAPNGASQICRLVIVGNSIHPRVSLLKPGDDIDMLVELEPEEEDRKQPKDDDGVYDDQGYNPAPAAILDEFISELLPAIPVTLMAGDTDMTNRALPQKPIHTTLLPRSRTYGTENPEHPEDAPGPWFETVTNPWEGEIEGWRMLGHSGQALDDIAKYFSVRWPKGSGQDGRLKLMESMLRWRSTAPTAPDTVVTYSFSEGDPLTLQNCPHVFFVGNQPRFETTTYSTPEGRSVRLLTIPRFCQTGEIVLLDTETLETEVVKFDAVQDADALGPVEIENGGEPD